MNGTCVTHLIDKKFIHSLDLRTLREERAWEDPGVCGKIILKWIFIMVLGCGQGKEFLDQLTISF
jgi:hypothetical protein